MWNEKELLSRSFQNEGEQAGSAAWIHTPKVNTQIPPGSFQEASLGRQRVFIHKPRKAKA